MIVAVAFGLTMAVRSYLRDRGKRVITCPKTAHAAAHVNVVNTAREAAFGKHHIRLDQCSRWPERQNCGQECLAQIEADAKGCTVWHMVDDWYKGKACAYCQKPFLKSTGMTGNPLFLRISSRLPELLHRGKLPASASRTAGGSRMGT